MRIEHFALNVTGAKDMVHWYHKHLAMPIHVENDGDVYVAFIGEAPGVLEIYENTTQAALPFADQHPLTLHIAFNSTDLNNDRDRLLAAGAEFIEGEADEEGYGLMMLRCPWGIAVQLCNRRQSIDGT